MRIVTGTIVLALFLLLLPVLGGILLQIFLSRRPQRWPGLLLPAFSFLLACLGCAMTALNLAVGIGGVSLVIGILLLAFLLMNIPTLLLLAIYFLCRGKYRRDGELKKMNLQDL